VHLCCASVIQGVTAWGIVPAIVRARITVAGLLVTLVFTGAGLSQVAFVAVLFAILTTLVAFETSRNLRPDAHPAPEEDAVGEEPVVEEERA